MFPYNLQQLQFENMRKYIYEHSNERGSLPSSFFFPGEIPAPLDLSFKSKIDRITPSSSPIQRTPNQQHSGSKEAPISPKTTPKSNSSLAKKLCKSKKQKATRKLNFDDELKSSPVSGTVILDKSEIRNNGNAAVVVIDPLFNVVEVTEEAKMELAKIENIIGDYACKLCEGMFEDAFGLARHRCSCIVHIEYRCPQCEKVFNCPANLASHRRWHKPKQQTTIQQSKLFKVYPNIHKSDIIIRKSVDYTDTRPSVDGSDAIFRSIDYTDLRLKLNYSDIARKSLDYSNIYKNVDSSDIISKNAEYSDIILRPVVKTSRIVDRLPGYP